jgi:hypothetical protein
MILYCPCNRSYQFHTHTRRFEDLDTGIGVEVCQCGRDLVPLAMTDWPVDPEALDAAGVAEVTKFDRGEGYERGVTMGKGLRRRIS